MSVMTSLSRVSCTGLSFSLTHSHFQMKCSARCRSTVCQVQRWSWGCCSRHRDSAATRILTKPYAQCGMFVPLPGLRLSTSLLSIAFTSSSLNCVLLCFHTRYGPQLLFQAALSVIGPWREPFCNFSVTSARFTQN